MEISFGTTPILDERSSLMAGSGFDLPVAVQVDPVALSGAEDLDPWDRGGRSCQITGSVTRQFDTHSEAVAFYATHGREVTAGARDTLTWSVDGVALATATAVVLQVNSRRPVGVSVTIDYSFISAPPAAPSP